MIGKMAGPSPLVIKTLVVVVFAVVGTISYNTYKDKTVVENTTLKPSLVSVENTISSVDTDGDTLYDWEENLLGTDIELMDTDGDGTPDGIEVALGRDPKIPGPDDLIENIENEEDSYVPDFPTDPESYTSQVGANLIQQILAASQSGTTLDKQGIVNEIAKQTESILSVQNYYNIDNILIDPSNSDDSIVKYMNEFVLTLNEEGDNVGFKPTDQESLNRFLIEYYENIHRRLSVTTVPEIFSQVHLQYLNSTYKTVRFFNLISSEFQDPLLAYAAVPKLQQEVLNMNLSFEQIVNYVENNDIIFEEEDPAYALFN